MSNTTHSPSIDERCAELARRLDAQCCSFALEAQEYAKAAVFGCGDIAESERAVIWCANRIIAMRTEQQPVTP